MFLALYYWGFSFIEVQGPPVNRKYVQGPHILWPLHTSEALAPLLVTLAHIQVALAPNSISQICGPCTWPLHLFLWPLHRPLPQKNEPFQLSKRYFSKFVVFWDLLFFWNLFFLDLFFFGICCFFSIIVVFWKVIFSKFVAFQICCF